MGHEFGTGSLKDCQNLFYLHKNITKTLLLSWIFSGKCYTTKYTKYCHFHAFKEMTQRCKKPVCLLSKIIYSLKYVYWKISTHPRTIKEKKNKRYQMDCQKFYLLKNCM